MSAKVAAPAVAGEILGNTALRIWGLTSAERLRRQLVKAGAEVVGVRAEVARAASVPGAAQNVGGVQQGSTAGNTGVAEDADPAGDNGATARVVMLRADWVYDDAIVRGLVASARELAAADPRGLALVAANGQVVAAVIPRARRADVGPLLEAGRAPADLRPVTPADLAGNYNDTLRKREPPYLMPLTAEALPAIEARVFGGAYKGVTDLVTLYVWPRPARAVTRVCANLGITPNMVTSASLVLVIAAMWAFWHGEYVLGLLAAWPMTFLDTVDGKLARVTLQSSRFGNVFDHSIDLIHPPLWWWAWIVGLPASGHPIADPSMVLTIIVVGYIAQRIEEGLFIGFFKMDMHVWRRFDSWFRLITARRNPNLVILTAATLMGRPDVGIMVVAVWIAICLVVHAVRLGQAALARRHGPLRSWLA